MAAGLLVSQPWHQSPAAPGNVRAQSPTATSARVSWTPSQGGATISDYLVLRDGKQVGVVPAGQSSYTDSSLTPGSTHRYAVIGESGTELSGASPTATVTTLTPSPVGIAQAKATWTTVTFHWSPSPQGPIPTYYMVYRGGSLLQIIPGTTTSYTASGLASSTSYSFAIAAEWGSVQSARTVPVQVSTLAPPLQGNVAVHLQATSVPDATKLKPGDHWSDTWKFTPSCVVHKCTFTVNASWNPSGGSGTPFTVKLTPNGSGYAGSTKVSVTECGAVKDSNTLTLKIADKNGGKNGAWNALAGNITLGLPYTSEPGTDLYCPSETWKFNVSGG